MSNYKHFELIRLLQTLTCSSYYNLENLLEMYTRCYPEDQKGIDLLNLIIFSEGPITNSSADEVIAHLHTHAKKH